MFDLQDYIQKYYPHLVYIPDMPTINRLEAERLGYPKNKYMLQTILLKKNNFTKKQAITWLKQHNFKYDDYRTTLHFHRFMQHFPVEGSKFITQKPYEDQVELVYQKF